MMTSRPSSRASNTSISQQKSLSGPSDTPKQARASNSSNSSKPPPSPSSSRSTPSPDLSHRQKCPACQQRRPHHHHHHHQTMDGRTSPSTAAIITSTSSAGNRPSIRRLSHEPPSPSSPSIAGNRSNNSSPRKERSPSIARSVSSLSTNSNDSPKSGGTDQRPRWVGAWSSTYTPPPSKYVNRRQSLPPNNNNNSNASSNSKNNSPTSVRSNNGLDEPPPLLSAYSPTIVRQAPRKRETYDSSRSNNGNNPTARGRSPSAAACLAARRGGGIQNKENSSSPCYTANSSGKSSRRASFCNTNTDRKEDDSSNHLKGDEMESIQNHGLGINAINSSDGSPVSLTESNAASLDDSLPPLHRLRPSALSATSIADTTADTTATATATIESSNRAWKFTPMPAPPIDTPPALIRKFLATESFAGPSFTTAFSHPASGSTSSPSNSPCPPSLITAPAVAAVSPVQFLAKSRVVVAEASSFIGQHSVSSSSSMSSLPCASATSSSTALSSDEKESASNLLTSSLLSYETTTTLLEQDEIEDQSSSIFTRWQQQRSPSPLGQSSISAEEASADNGKNSIVGEDRSVTPTPSGTADSLRTRPSFDTLSVERPGTPTSYSSPAQELFSRIMDQNNDHMNNNSRRHSMGSLVDIMANKARSYLSPRTNEEKSNSAVSNSSGRRMSSTLSAGGTTAIAARSQRNSICGPLAPLPPLPPTHQQTNPNPQVVRVSSIESFPRHPSSSSNLRIQSLRDLFRSSASSSTASGGSGANSAATTPSHSRTPTVDSTADVNSHGTNKNNSASGTRRNSLMDFFSSNSKPQPNTASDDDRSAIITSSSTSTVTRHRSETNGSVVSTSTTSSMAYAPSVSKKLGSRPPLSVIAPPLVVPQVKQSPKLTHASLLSLTSNDNDARSSTSSSSSTTSSSSDPLRRPKYQVLTTPSSSTNNTSSNSVDHGSTHGYKPSPLPSFTVVNEIWMDPTTHTFHQLPGVLLTPSLPFPLTLPILPTSSSNASLNSSSTSVTATATTTTLPPPPLSATTTTTSSATTTTTTTTTTQPAQSSQALLPTTEGIEWPWSNMNPNDRDKWPTAFHIAAQQGGILALPPTYSPGSELDEVSALSLSRTNSNMIDYGSSVMEPRYYFGTGGLGNEGRQGGYYGSGSGNESVPNSLAGSRMSAGGGSLYYYDETLGQTPYGNGFLQGPTIPQQYSLLYHQSPSGPGY